MDLLQIGRNQTTYSVKNLKVIKNKTKIKNIHLYIFNYLLIKGLD